MFVFSFKSTKLKLVLLAIAALLAALLLIWAVGRNREASSDGTINYSAQDAEERLAFLAQFGWEVEEDPVEVAEVLIPGEFDAVYSKYNAIQTAQSLDLKPYANERVKRWSYAVKNYPDQEDSAVIRANLLVYDGRVIGGDICSLAIEGFMHGFEGGKQTLESTTAGETKRETTTRAAARTTTEAAETTQAEEKDGKKGCSTAKETTQAAKGKDAKKSGCNTQKETTTRKRS